VIAETKPGEGAAPPEPVGDSASALAPLPDPGSGAARTDCEVGPIHNVGHRERVVA
jgi:hypothetical protein